MAKQSKFPEAIMAEKIHMYPDDGGLKPQVRKFEDTLSVFTVLKERYGPHLLTDKERQRIAERDSTSAQRLEAERIAIADKAREWAGNYSAGSDGRNTFILFAEWVEARSKS